MGTWPLDDEVVGLRVFGTDQIHELSTGPRVRLIGSARGCEVLLREHGVAARHAKLLRRGSGWLIQALADDGGGVYRDRVALPEFPLVPGLSIGIGAVTLVAESERSRAVHRHLQRLIGFGSRLRVDVDRALRAVLHAASGRRALLLCGEGDLVYVARQLHRHTLGEQPFVVCDPRRGTSRGTGRSPPNNRDPMAALAAAAGGTLCISAQRLPDEFPRMVERWRGSQVRVQLVLHARAGDPVLSTVADVLELAPLFVRWRDRFRIISEVAAEAAAELGIAPRAMSAADRNLLLESSAATLSELETATVRLLAIRHWARGWGGLARAARELGMTHASLAEWAARRGLITVRHRKTSSRSSRSAR